ncbi:MAG: hybrid sensor histidine kinase/response regulator [Bacteroidales bacterium]|nr:hybrid sensor histidine kinase/response regulator [Bacteroidales bacterium]
MESTKSLVLIVDDIPSNVEFLTDILGTMDDIEIQGVYNGQSTLEFISQRIPDLILLDVSMPIIDGFEVCKILKADPKTVDIPIIFLTAKVQQEDILQGFELGAIDYITKPFNLNELVSRVRTHLELGLKTKQLQEVNLHLEEMVEQRTRELIKTNQELSSANKKLSQMYEELSALDFAKDDFIAHINHELRTPLNGILAHTAILEEGCGEENKNLKSINDLVSRLINVSEITLLLTELRTKDNKINISKTQFSGCLQRAIPVELSQKKNITINYSGIDEKIFVMAEPQLLSRCIHIVLDNAVKYSPVNGEISVQGRDNIQFFTLDIQDQGPGFSGMALSNLFELFKADNLEHRSHGFGLGLATAKKIIDLLGGKIKICNTKAGASVMLHLKKA